MSLNKLQVEVSRNIKSNLSLMWKYSKKDDESDRTYILWSVSNAKLLYEAQAYVSTARNETRLKIQLLQNKELNLWRFVLETTSKEQWTEIETEL